ncbi:MAG: uroporphyrinogen-III synthase [Gemmatimonadota bacterium]
MSRLAGRVVATTRDGAPDDPLTRKLEAEGAAVLEWPTLGFAPPAEPGPLERARTAVREDSYDWVVFTSARAVDALGNGQGVSERLRVAAVGEATARALREAGWRVAVTGASDAEGLVEALARATELDGLRVLFPAASLAGSTLEDELERRGARVDRIEAYRTMITPPDPARVRAESARGVDVVTFASPSAVASLEGTLADAWPGVFAGVVFAAIGPSTERALIAAGIESERIRTADPPSLDGLVEACVASVDTIKRKRT